MFLRDYRVVQDSVIDRHYVGVYLVSDVTPNPLPMWIFQRQKVLSLLRFLPLKFVLRQTHKGKRITQVEREVTSLPLKTKLPFNARR
jgi:hypothetical protein